MTLSDKCIAYYKCDTNSGNIVFDSIGSADGTSNSSTLWDNGIINNGLNLETDYFDGFGEPLTSFNPYDRTSGALSVWNKLDSVNNENGGIFHHRIGGDSRMYLFRNNNSIGCTVGDSHGEATNINYGERYHIVLQFNNVAAELYINSVLQDIFSYSTGTGYPPVDPRFGGNPDFDVKNTNPGICDEYAFFNTTLSSTEVSELYNNGDGLQYPFDTTPTKYRGNIFFGFGCGSKTPAPKPEPGWQILDSNFGTKTNRVYNGTYSGGIEKDGAGVDIAKKNAIYLGKQVDKFSFYWNEDASSYGGGIVLEDSNGNEVCGFFTDNDQWVLYDNNGATEIKGTDDVYDVWNYVEFTFDWTNGQYDYYIKRLSDNTTRSGTGQPLLNDTNIEDILIKSYNSQTGTNMYMWFDNIELTTGGITDFIEDFENFQTV